MPTPSPRPATARWEHRYREVLDAAAVAIAEKGYLGASTKDIADRLGIRQGSLYYYFPSKETALAAICELGVKDFIANLHGILDKPISSAEKLRAAVANHLLPLRSHPEADYIRVFLRHRHELPPGLRHAIAALARTYQKLFERMFVEAVAIGEFRADLDPRLATLALLGLCNSVISAREERSPKRVDEIIDEYARIFLEGVMIAKGADARSKRKSAAVSLARKRKG